VLCCASGRPARVRCRRQGLPVACCARTLRFRSSRLAGARVVAVRRASRRGFGHRAQATTIGALRGIPSSAIVSSSGIATGCRSNYSVKRTPVNRLRSSKRCGRRRLPQALGGQQRLRFKCSVAVAWRLRSAPALRASLEVLAALSAFAPSSLPRAARLQASAVRLATRSAFDPSSWSCAERLQQRVASLCAAHSRGGVAPARLPLPERSASCTVCLTIRSSGRRSIACASSKLCGAGAA